MGKNSVYVVYAWKRAANAWYPRVLMMMAAGPAGVRARA